MNSLSMNSPLLGVINELYVTEPEIARALLKGEEPKIENWSVKAAEACIFSRSAGALILGEMSADDEVDYGSRLVELVRNKDTKALRSLADYLDKLNNGKAQLQQFAAALGCAAYFKSLHGREPTKAELKGIMIDLKVPHPQDDDNKGWARVFKDAGLDDLKKKKAKRGRSRHGG